MQTMRSTLAAGLLALVLLAGCGGAEELSGEADVPEGYALFRSDGVSFVHPEGFEAATRDNANGIREITLREPGAGRDSDYIHLTIAPDRGEEIEPLVRSLRVAVESIFKAEAGDEREVDVEGARSARRLDIVQPARGGAPKVERRDLLVLAPDERFFILDVGAVDGGGGIDRDAVIESFRLGGSGALAFALPRRLSLVAGADRRADPKRRDDRHEGGRP
jgi:hypothetical protein